VNDLKHEWIGLGYADMTQSQADEWVTVSGNHADTPLALFIRTIVCMRCDQPYGEATESCPRMGVVEPDTSADDADPRTLHHWTTMMTIEMSEEEAEGWRTSEGIELQMSPHSVGLLCALCGQPFEQASPACPERALLAGVSDDD